MTMRSLVSGLSAGAVMLAAGAAFSGGVASVHAQIMSFDSASGELWAVPDGQNAAVFLNQPFTSYLPATVTPVEPPDPCFQLASYWNFVVSYDTTFNTKSAFVYGVLMNAMATQACGVTVTSLASGSPQPLVAIRPSTK